MFIEYKKHRILFTPPHMMACVKNDFCSLAMFCGYFLDENIGRTEKHEKVVD